MEVGWKQRTDINARAHDIVQSMPAAIVLTEEAYCRGGFSSNSRKTSTGTHHPHQTVHRRKHALKRLTPDNDFTSELPLVPPAVVIFGRKTAKNCASRHQI
jgi:hypothetical protein